jgi:hypothetical protein
MQRQPTSRQHTAALFYYLRAARATSVGCFASARLLLLVLALLMPLLLLLLLLLLNVKGPPEASSRACTAGHSSTRYVRL